MFKIESYVTPILLSYVDKYVRDFNPANAQVSLWGGGVALHNLVLKPDVLQQEVSLPFTLISGRIHELLIQVPWTKIMSEPIIVTIDTIECVLNLKPPVSLDESPPPAPRHKTPVVEAPPGYMQALVRRVVSNIALRVHHLIVKYVQDDIVLSLNVKHLFIDSAGLNWEPAFADIDQNQPTVRRLVKVDDLTLCLDKADADGKIRYYQEPLLYRCQLDLRVLTRLVSANTRRAASLSVSVRSSKLAFSVTSDQLTLLLRLMKEREQIDAKAPPATPRTSLLPPNTQQATNLKSGSSESARSTNSWSEWAWSWLPTWADKEGGLEDIPESPTPIPLYFDAFVDDLSLVFKVMELVEGLSRKRSRSVIEVCAQHAALRSATCAPTARAVRFGARDLLLRSHGKCVCGVTNYDASQERPTLYVKRVEVAESAGGAAGAEGAEGADEAQPWAWPAESFAEPELGQGRVETAQAVGEEYRASPSPSPPIPEDSSPEGVDRPTSSTAQEPSEATDELDLFWVKLSPLIYVEFTHERSPPSPNMNPYDNPPSDFQYSDWVESARIKVKLEPVEVRLCMGLIHRLMALRSIFKEVETVETELPMRVLTVEECESLMDNLPERRVTLEVRGLRVRMVPWNHYFTAKPIKAPAVLGLDLPNLNMSISGPLYPHRVCSAACQMPEDSGPLWQAARVHASVVVRDAQLVLTTIDNAQQRPCARAHLHLVMHALLNKAFFSKRESVFFSHSLKISEMSVSGSSPRLQAAWCAIESLLKDQMSVVLRHSSLARDALNDEDAVVIDFSLEEFICRGYFTKNIKTMILSLQSARATAFHEPSPGKVKQAWLFSAPDAPTTTPYLRMALQWCEASAPNTFEYLGFWAEPTALSVDPLLIAWLAYKPVMKPIHLSATSLQNIPKGSVQYFTKRRLSWSSGARSRSGLGAELVHSRPRTSLGSGSEPGERKPAAKPAAGTGAAWWHGDGLVALHQRLRGMLVHVEMGLIQAYVTMSTASALDCVTLRDAMERHALAAHRVLAISLGRLAMHSNAANKHLWQDLRHDGPTFISQKPEAESFPWKIRIADVSCYTLEAGTTDRDHSGSALRSTLKAQAAFAHPRTVLELVTTTITVSVVTKMLQIKNIELVPEGKKVDSSTYTEKTEKTKYFTGGLEFKPTTLTEFFRGPQRRSFRKEGRKAGDDSKPEPVDPQKEGREKVTVREGPVVSLGVHLHADTPPVIVKLEKEQIHVVAVALHCFSHIITLVQRERLDEEREPSYHTLGAAASSHRSFLPRSVSEQEPTRTPSEGSLSKSSDLIEIFDRSQEGAPKKPLTTFLWCQWVVSHATVIIASRTVKLAFDVDDIISTVDLQPHYNQLKVKVASASVKHYELNEDDEWAAGVLGGRVLEAREMPTGTKDEDQFLAVTITQAHISQLPDSWKQELHPKLIENKTGEDVMWEVYATLAPLEAVVQPVILDNAATLLRELVPKAYCYIDVELDKSASTRTWPFCYVSAGGLRLLITGSDSTTQSPDDDTLVFTFDKVTMNPHPDNPICRRLVNAADSGWLGGATNYEGRQYELTVKRVELRSAQFKQLIAEENVDLEKNTNSNPAVKWNQSVQEPNLTPILYPLDVCVVLAPALYLRGALTCGPAAELNLLTDCAVEVNIEQVVLAQKLLAEMYAGFTDRELRIFADHDNVGVCPYADVLKITMPEASESEITLMDEASLAGDSGVDTVASQSTSAKGKTYFADEVPLKKSVSIAFSEHMASSGGEEVEVYVTVGTLEAALYVRDDNSPELIPLRAPHPAAAHAHAAAPLPSRLRPTMSTTKLTDGKDMSSSSSKSLTDTARDELAPKAPQMKPFKGGTNKRESGHIPLLHATFKQPNLYYFKRKDVKNFQVSLFDVRVGLGKGDATGAWNAVLVSTAKGTPDPVTEIPPALATLKIVAPGSSSNYSSTTNQKGTIRLDVERPVQVEISTDSLKRLISIHQILMDRLIFDEDTLLTSEQQDVSPLYKLRHAFLQENIEHMSVATSQVALCGGEGCVSWDALAGHVVVSSRPHRVGARALLTALVLASGPATDRRHVVLQPLMAGCELEATWEAWRRAEGGPASRDPSVYVSVELGRAVAELRPADLAAAHRLQRAVEEVQGHRRLSSHHGSLDSLMRHRTPPRSSLRHSASFSGESEGGATHYYKDDLRSGAFKIQTGSQLPMAYQIMLYGNTVSWRYPHPRSITRIVAYPLPGMDQETECVLELYAAMQGEWETHTYFKIPIGEPREILLQSKPPDVVFSSIWRLRTCSDSDPIPKPYDFKVEKFVEKPTSLLVDKNSDTTKPKLVGSVTAEQVSGVVRVDSCFAPRVLPRVKLTVQVADTELHVHNSVPTFTSQETMLEGYYVSRPLMRSHRVLSVFARSSKYHARLASTSGVLLVLNTALSVDIAECATGTMEQLVRELVAQAGATLASLGGERPRVRVCASRVHAALTVPRLRTLHALARDWLTAYQQLVPEPEYTSQTEVTEQRTAAETATEAALALEGRVSLWLHNSCTSALRVGQEGTDEVVPLGPGVRLAYRWRCPASPKRLRLALATPTANWHWSGSIPFTPGTTRVKLEQPEPDRADKAEARALGVYVHVRVDETGGKRYMHLCGRLLLANMLRYRLLYKVRARYEELGGWRTVCSDEMDAEHVGRSVLAATDTEMVLKIKFVNHDAGWSGDIPLKECPKENVPWLVKVPSEGEVPYVSVWCRVVRARSDGRVIATVWPLYVLHSHLPLDTDVLIVTEKNRLKPGAPVEQQPAPLIQSTPGRGASTHLLAPGTTANRHSLSFQYRNIQCPVTREAVPLHYGVTDVSVFDKRTPVAHVDDVVHDIHAWLKRSGRQATSLWPYSLVAKHWLDTWQPALLQPRCDVTVRYQAIRAGGGCSLEIQLCPLVLLCNAAPLALTLRAHDAAPLCVLKSGTAISPPSGILTKPFFLSVEIGRETFVSERLQVSKEQPGRYGAPAPGHVALDHAAHFSVLCNQKVALLTMYYEIKENINVLGISSTFVLINRLNTDLRVSAVAVPADNIELHNIRGQTYKVVKPTKDGSIQGTALCRFLVRGRWRGGSPAELHKFVCVALPTDRASAASPVPVRLGAAPSRRALALHDDTGASVPVTVTQLQHDSRVLVVVAYDMCPQFLVHNLTRVPFCVAQPEPPADDQPSTSKVVLGPRGSIWSLRVRNPRRIAFEEQQLIRRALEAPLEYGKLREECAGAQWWCVVPAESALHYSTPTHCARFPPPPPPAPPPQEPAVTLLSFGKLIEDSVRVYHEWCAPIAVTEGEQLLQFQGGVTIKLRVRMHPHSTLLVLRDTDQHDLSASDIRKRLHTALRAQSSAIDLHLNRDSMHSSSIERNNAVSRLFDAPKEFDIPKSTPSLVPLMQDSEQQREGRDASISMPPTPDTATTSSRELNKPDDTDALPTTQELLKDFSIHTPPTRTGAMTSVLTDSSELEVESSQLQEGSESQERHERDSLIKLLDRPSVQEIHPAKVESLSSSMSSAFSKVAFKDHSGGERSKKRTRSDINLSRPDLAFHGKPSEELSVCDNAEHGEWVRCVVGGIVVELTASAEAPPLCALHLDRTALMLIADRQKTRTVISVADVQIDNLQYESGQYDFAVVASTRATPLPPDPWPALWNMFGDKATFSTRYRDASLMLKIHQDKWHVVTHSHNEITELEVRLGSLALFIEDAYITALLELYRLVVPAGPAGDADACLSEERAIQNPLRLRLLYIHPLNLNLTLHTAVRMYIALDQSPLRLSAFKLHNMMTSAERLSHALTVHYLSAAILGAGWVVGGLELLGAPGAIAARLGEATGGVKGMASATAAALLRSLSAWAGSLARNLDLLAGDEEHARRAAAARRRPPTSLIAGLVAGITNFAINILGAVGGLAHHPLVGVAVGESDSGALALRRGLLGALTKPLSATADLVAYAGHGLLRQAGWDPVLQPRCEWRMVSMRESAGWRRDCVRWAFRLAELHALAGFEVMLDNSPLLLLVTHKYLVVADPETERIVEMIDLKSCTLSPYHGQIVELNVAHGRRTTRVGEGKATDEDDEYQITATAMARVARYTGAGAAAGAGAGAEGHAEVRLLSLLTPPGRDHSLYAALATLLHQNADTHLAIL